MKERHEKISSRKDWPNPNATSPQAAFIILDIAPDLHLEGCETISKELSPILT